MNILYMFQYYNIEKNNMLKQKTKKLHAFEKVA